MSDFIPFALPDIGQEEIDAVVNCMKSGWLTTGAAAKQFEEDFANYLGGKVEAVAVNSATMGLLLAMEALGVKAGDEVIVPVYTFSATAMMAVHLGARPILVDIELETLNIDPAKIEKAITSKTKGIVVVHFAGLACNMEQIHAIAKQHNLFVIEDAAHSFPTYYKGKLIGNCTSDATIYSFYATKTITTGEGGMLVSANPKVIERAKVMRLHGISRDAFDRYTSREVNWRYEIVAPGSKCNMTDIAAAIGIEQLKKADAFRQRRTEIAYFYNEQFKDLPIILPADSKDKNDHSWHLYVIRVRPGFAKSRDQIIEEYARAGIRTSVHFIPLNLHSYYQEMWGYKPGDFPVAEEAFESAISLPIYTKMTDEEVKRVAQVTKQMFLID